MQRPWFPFAVALLLTSSCSSSVTNDGCPPGSLECDDGCCVLCNSHQDCTEAGEACCDGFCSTVCNDCRASESVCADNACHDLSIDFWNCGDCGTSCAAQGGERVDACVAGRCICEGLNRPCSEGFTCCAGGCVDTTRSHTHCGECLNDCGTNRICINSGCEVDNLNVCGAETRCAVGDGFECADLQTTYAHCGDCATDCAVTMGARADACASGTCVCAGEGTGEQPCPSGEECTPTGCAALTCNDGTCSQGCCDGLDCRSRTAATCGTGGAACQDCTTLNGRADECAANGECVCNSAGILCPTDQTCGDNGCEEACADECQLGETGCTNDVIWSCEAQSDGCNDRADGTDCGGLQEMGLNVYTCSAGQCVCRHCCTGNQICPGSAVTTTDCGGSRCCEVACEGAQCGDGVCFGETSATCPQDCCDVNTPCGVSWRDRGQEYCRSTDNVIYNWVPLSTLNAACDDTADICTSQYYCAGTSQLCKELPGVWADGPCECTDGYCTAPEDCVTCDADCGTCICGDGDCTGSENGTSCPDDCCDADTPCSHTRQGDGVTYCRSMNGGAYAWVTEAQVTPYCDETSDLCSSYTDCGGDPRAYCKELPNIWNPGPCTCPDGFCTPDEDCVCSDCPACVCGDGNCEGTENGANCPEECCDADTPCTQTRGDAGTHYCRSMNGGSYNWITTATAESYCNSTGELCSSRSDCGGETTAYCKELPNAWNPGPCTCPDGYCTPGEDCGCSDCPSYPCVCGNGICETGENGSSCGEDCCDASTPCSTTREGLGVHYCRSMNGGAYNWITISGAANYCDSAAEECSSWTNCGGEPTSYCKDYTTNGWGQGTCTCPDGFCTAGEDSGSCPADCP